MLRSQMELVAHDPSWCDWFAEESCRIRRALGDVALDVEHIGSTAVPGLIAKPIIDIALIIAGVEDCERFRPPLVGLGYRYRGRHGEDPLRRYFVLERTGKRVAQLHVWAAESPSWRLAVAFRDLLRDRADLRAAYAREKLRVAEAVGWDKSRYSIEKGPFIEALVRSELLAQGPG